MSAGVTGDSGAVERTVEQTLGHLRALDTQDVQPRPALTLEDLYRQHRMRFVRLAILLVDDPATAEDVVQVAFAGLHRHLHGLREAAAEVGEMRFVYASSSSIYGNVPGPRRETDLPQPYSPYGVTKLACESLAGAYAPSPGLDAGGMRFFSVYAPRQRPHMALPAGLGCLARHRAEERTE